MSNPKSAFISGASKGIGLAIAKLFAKNDIIVTCASRTIEDLETVVSEIKRSGGKAQAEPAIEYQGWF